MLQSIKTAKSEILRFSLMQSEPLMHKHSIFNTFKIERLKVCLLTLFPSDCSLHHIYKLILFVQY